MLRRLPRSATSQIRPNSGTNGIHGITEAMWYSGSWSGRLDSNQRASEPQSVQSTATRGTAGPRRSPRPEARHVESGGLSVLSRAEWHEAVRIVVAQGDSVLIGGRVVLLEHDRIASVP